MKGYSNWNKAQQIRIKQSFEKFKTTDPEKYKKLMDDFNEKLKTNQEIPDCILEAGSAVIKQYEREVQLEVDKLIKPESFQTPHLPKCPTCSSANVHKISGVSKAASGALFGVFSLGYISKTFQCDNCGYQW